MTLKKNPVKISNLLENVIKGIARSRPELKYLFEDDDEFSGKYNDLAPSDKNPRVGDDQSGDLLLDDEPEPSDEQQDDVGATKPDDAALESGEIDSDEVIEKLNTIRSGRSFRDSSVKTELENYINELSTAEKTAFFAFLKAVAGIVTKEIPAEDAVEPSDPAPNVTMKKSNPAKSVKFKPKVVVTKKPTEKKEKAPAEEDTTPPAPIKPVRK